MTGWIALATAYAGFVALGLAMDRHQLQMLGHALSPRYAVPLRLAGGVLLGGSLSVCLSAWTTSVAVLWWLGLATLAGMALGLLLAYRPRWARPFGVATAAAAAGGWLVRISA